MAGTADQSQADVIVVGSGAAGLMSAVEAAEAGASVTVLESENTTGGSTRLSGAYVALCETDLQPGTRAELLEDLLESHHGDCREDLSRLYVEEAPETFRRLAHHGIEFVRTFQFAHMTKPWAHELSGEKMGGGAEIVTMLEAAARRLGVRIQTGAKVARLLVENGRVAGVVVESAGERRELRARRGVVLATGGFTRSRELIRTFGRPGTERMLPLTGEGSRGDGILLGMSAGAGLSYMAAGVAPTSPTDPDTGKGVMVLYAGAVALNKAGKRFCRESDLYIDTCWAALDQPEGAFVQIYDSAMREAYADTMMGKVLTGFREIEAGSIEELLGKVDAEMGIDRKEALATLQSYNAAVRDGRADEFGRTNLVGTSGAMAEVSKAPFYAAICRAGTTHFNGGLAVDTDMAVLDVFGEPIPGLFAAGETTGGFHGIGYMSGTFVGMALIFGRVAGRNAAAAGN